MTKQLNPKQQQNSEVQSCDDCRMIIYKKNQIEIEEKGELDRVGIGVENG